MESKTHASPSYPGARGVMKEHSIKKLADLNISKSNIETLVKNTHQNAIKYLTYLVLNKIKLTYEQAPVLPPP